jgi:hypothetical protein
LAAKCHAILNELLQRLGIRPFCHRTVTLVKNTVFAPTFFNRPVIPGQAMGQALLFDLKRRTRLFARWVEVLDTKKPRHGLCLCIQVACQCGDQRA